MNSPAMDFKDYLISYSAESSAEIEFILGTNLFVSLLPETSILALGVFDTPGMSPEPNNIRIPTVQIIVRGVNGGYVAAWNMIEIVSNLFHDLANETIGSTRYILVRKLAESFHIGNDSKGRPMFGCNFSAMRTE